MSVQRSFAFCQLIQLQSSVRLVDKNEASNVIIVAGLQSHYLLFIPDDFERLNQTSRQIQTKTQVLGIK